MRHSSTLQIARLQELSGNWSLASQNANVVYVTIRRVSADVRLEWEEDLIFKGFWKGSVPQDGPESKRTGKVTVYIGSKRFGVVFTTAALARQMQNPEADGYLAMDSSEGKWLRWYQGHWYWDSEDHEPEEAKALIGAYEIRKRQSIDRAKSLAAKSSEKEGVIRRGSIPTDLRILVWERDGGKCVQCDSKEDLQFDHIIPVVMGGGTSDQNLQILCGSCNRSKGASLG